MRKFNKKNRRISICILLVISFFSANIVGCTSNSKKDDQEKASVHKLNEMELSEMNGEYIKETNYSKDTYGENAQILSLFSKIFNECLNRDNTYKEKVNSFKFDQYINQESLSDKDTLNKAINEVENLKNDLSEYKSQCEKETKSIEDLTKKFKLSSSDKKSFLHEIDENFSSYEELFESNYKITNDIYNKMISYFQFFYELDGNFKYEGKVFYFNDQKQADTFNELTSEIKDLSQQDNKLMDEYNDKKNNLTNQLKK